MKILFWMQENIQAVSHFLVERFCKYIKKNKNEGGKKLQRICRTLYVLGGGREYREPVKKGLCSLSILCDPTKCPDHLGENFQFSVGMTEPDSLSRFGARARLLLFL